MMDGQRLDMHLKLYNNNAMLIYVHRFESFGLHLVGHLYSGLTFGKSATGSTFKAIRPKMQIDILRIILHAQITKNSRNATAALAKRRTLAYLSTFLA